MVTVHPEKVHSPFESDWSWEPAIKSLNSSKLTNASNKNLIKEEKKSESLSTGQNGATPHRTFVILAVTISLLVGCGVLTTVLILWLSPVKYNNPATTTSTTTTSTTTTAAIILSCGFSCATQTWSSALNILARWYFDEDLNDNTNNYATYTVNSASFVDGYRNKALLLDSTLNPLFSTSYIPLQNSSFTIDAWLYPTAFPNSNDHIIAAMCPNATNDTCLILSIRNNNTNCYLYFGFYNESLSGAITMSTNQWVHVAFVFDISTYLQKIYINGVLDNTRTASSSLLISSGNFSIGYKSITDLVNESFVGYIDQFSVTSRAKSGCEILEEATIEAWFTFDSGVLPLIDIGPYSISTIASAYTIISGRSSSQAISFLDSQNSYFRAYGFTALGISNHAFSISFWINPQSLQGILVHLSATSNGTGWCLPLLGLTDNGTVVAQILGSSVSSLVGYNISLNTWSNIVQTWSIYNGLQLYVNSERTSLSSAASFNVGGVPSMYITLASSLSGSGICQQGILNTSKAFTGTIDDFRVYNRELTSTDVCKIYNS